MKERLGLKGHWTIVIRQDGRVIRTVEIDNQLTNLYQHSVLDQLKGNEFASLEIKYFAVGVGTTLATAEDTQLEDEQFRSVPTSKTIMDGYLQTIWVLTTEQANFRIREIGVFAGDATSTVDSGTLLSRISVDIEKTENLEITFIRRDYVNI